VTHVCPTCCEHELVPHPSLEGWLHCPGCSRAVLADDLADLVERLAEQGADQLTRDILACWRDSECREVTGGGGDDGLSLTFMRPLPDERLVRESTKPIAPLLYPLQVHRVKCSSDDMRRALHDWIRAQPSPQEVAELLELLGGLRRARP